MRATAFSARDKGRKKQLTHYEQIPSYDYQASISPYGLEPNNPTPINFVSTTSDYLCVITAVTNLLQYYRDFMNADVYAEKVNSVSSLRQYLDQGGPDNGYVYNGGTYLKLIVGRHNYDGHIRSGLQAYFNRSDVDTYTVNATNRGKTTINDVKMQLNTYARPVVLGINTSAIKPDSITGHAVLAYSYAETSLTTYFITNDGWGSNYCFICADDILLNWLDMLYLS